MTRLYFCLLSVLFTDVESTNGNNYNDDESKRDDKKDSNNELRQKTNVLKFPCYDYTQDSKHMSLKTNHNSQVNIQLNKTNAPTKKDEGKVPNVHAPCTVL